MYDLNDSELNHVAGACGVYQRPEHQCGRPVHYGCDNGYGSRYENASNWSNQENILVAPQVNLVLFSTNYGNLGGVSSSQGNSSGQGIWQ